MFCKTIILSNSENLTTNAPKGILTLSKENTTIKGKVRLYNLISLPQNTKIGLYINEKVYISVLTRKANHYEFDLNENIDITQSIYCALIDHNNNKKVLLEGGSFNGFYFTDSPFDAILEAKDEQLDQTIDNALKKTETCESCSCTNCEYKKYFYEQYCPDNNKIYSPITNNTHLTPNECFYGESSSNYPDDRNNSTHFNSPIENKVPKLDYIDGIQSNIVDNLNKEVFKNFEDLDDYFYTSNSIAYTTNSEKDMLAGAKNYNKAKDIYQQSNNKPNNDEDNEKLEFLNDIIYQLDEMLERHPEEDVLNSIIPNSKFVKVDGDKPYVLGVIYEDKMLKYIAYGVPAKYNTLPPKDLGQHYQWLPLNPRDVMSDGYFMIYQDATNGTIVEINFE